MHSGAEMITTLQNKWNNKRLLSFCIFSISLLIFIVAFSFVFNPSPLIIVAAVSGAAVLLYKLKPAKINTRDVTNYLNKTIPAYEESAHLLTEDRSLNTLEKIQISKIRSVVVEDAIQPIKIKRESKNAWVSFFIAVTVSAALLLLPKDIFSGNDLSSISITANEKRSPLPPQINKAEIVITAPAYLNKKQTKQSNLNLSIELHSIVKWHLVTDQKVERIELIINNAPTGTFSTQNKTKWEKQIQFNRSGFYQFKIDGVLSPIYTVETRADQLPVFTVIKPTEVTEIEPGMRSLIALDAMITDDHGLQSLTASATIASGRGEAVKFKELQLSSNSLNSVQRFQFKKQLDLAGLGMKGGDEMYLYLSARDSYNQEKKSDIYIIRIADTANLMSIEGLASGIDVKPEFFRSQRQIIIETQQLLLSKDTMSAQLFQQRSNELGTDQKLLRLRYGKFLGEETDVDIGHDDDDHDDASEDIAAANQKTIDQYSHKHDNAEDATFFDAQTKKQLKAVLAEMWNSELKLRSIQPAAALPFEYKALKLLKELQQQTRVYVSKTGIKTAPLSNGKRLTGELDKISPAVTSVQYKTDDDGPKATEKALTTLQSLNASATLNATQTETLRQAAVSLGDHAIAQPSVYAVSFQSLRNMLSGKFSSKDITNAGKGLHLLLKEQRILPSNYKTTRNGLSEQYFQRLKTNR